MGRHGEGVLGMDDEDKDSTDPQMVVVGTGEVVRVRLDFCREIPRCAIYCKR